MGISEQRRRVRAILAADACVHPAPVFDPISARIAVDLGFELGILAGSTASLAVLGAPDVALLTLGELVEQTRRTARACGLPLIVDADHGYGNALSVMRTVHELEAAGAAALTIEDTWLPRAYSAPAMQLISIEEGLGKIRAALAARADPELVIVARTNALMVTDTDDAVARALAYAQAGADAVFFSGAGSYDQLRAVHAAVDRPIILGATKGDLRDSAALAGLGVRITLQGNQPVLAAIQAVYDTLRGLRHGTVLPKQASAELIRQFTKQDAYAAAERDFLGG